jgi:predicted ATPase
MITGIEIENFKGVGERIRLDLRPITLLFGANSSGKSTCIHALHYAREIFERHNLDPDQTIAGGSYVDLGGFGSLVHGRDRNSSVKIRININVEENQLPDFGADHELLDEIMDSNLLQILKIGELEAAAVELTISWSFVENCPFISSNKIFINGDLFAEITAMPNLREVALKIVDDHPGLQTLMDLPWTLQGDDEYHFDGSAYSPTDSTLKMVKEECEDVINSIGEIWPLPEQRDALPNIDKPLSVPISETALPDTPEQTEIRTREKIAAAYISEISNLIVGPCQLIREQLMNFRYLGPLRKTPPRNYQAPRKSDPSRWASGLGCWDALENDKKKLTERVGDWLGDEDKLNSGYRIESQLFMELDTLDPHFARIISGRAFDDAVDDNMNLETTEQRLKKRLVINPNNTELQLRPHDVGVGISQVVPVVVTALDGENRVLAIEQPELHLHPKLQAELADLFIEAALGDSKHLVILETHSEHLIHRFKRRIRETEQEGGNLFDRQVRTTDIAINYLSQIDGCSSVRRIDVDVNGEFVQPWPDDFFDIEFNERFPDAR